jgi:non-specific serine/threonine protein kinase
VGESIAFGDLLRDYRRAAGLTQEQLAECAGISPRSISEMERGSAHVPRRDTIALLARGLGLSEGERSAFESLVASARRPRRTPDRAPRRTVDDAPPEPTPQPEDGKHNVPRALTSFVGRERELAELGRALRAAPLLTLIGAGGVGKTRLAQELVRAHAGDYADGAWLVELASLRDAILVPRAVAAAVGMRDVRERDATSALVEFLQPKRLLLTLDNCEHLIEACAELVATLLRGCPMLQVVATSREPLAIPGEILRAVAPLDLPDTRTPQSSEQLLRSAAVQLFVERARAANDALQVTPEILPVIARICVGLDGIPLALELAAARTRMLTVDQLAERLEHDSDVLGRTVRADLPQHQTMRATLDWSYELLSTHERTLLQRVSVFAGGWTLDMAEEVCPGEGITRTEILHLLQQLVDKSMVLVDATQSSARYRLLEPIRHYAAERFDASGEAAAYRARHAAAYLELAEIADVDPAGAAEISSLDRLEREHENLRVALRWALANQRHVMALRGAAALFQFWERRGHFQEGCTWLRQALAAGAEAPAEYRARALNALACLYWRGPSIDGASGIAEQALQLSREAGDARDIAWALLNRGMIAYFRDDAEAAIGYLEESVQVARTAGRMALLGLALTFAGRARMWAHGPDDARATSLIVEGLSVAEEAQSRLPMGHALLTLGDRAWRRGDVEGALGYWRRSLVVRSEALDRRGIAGSIERLAWGMAETRRFEHAAWLFATAEAQHQALGVEPRHDEVRDHERLVAATRQYLGGFYVTLYAAGKAASVEEAVMRALSATANRTRKAA